MSKWSFRGKSKQVVFLAASVLFVMLSVSALASPIIHNSTTLGSTKWGGSWGVNGGKYGEFTCMTCHDKFATNAKRVRADIVAPNTPTDALPIELGATSVSLLDTRDGTADFGDDSSTGRSDDGVTDFTSDKICEACHTQTKFHNYDATLNASNGGDRVHFNDKDCIQCHEHRAGFAVPLCSNCHGGSMSGATEKNFWPDGGVENVDDAGSENDRGDHLKHMTALAALDGMTLQQLLDHANSRNLQIAYCDRCHLSSGGGTEHAKGDDVGDIGTLLAMDGSADGGTAASYLSGPQTCSSVDCHNGSSSASLGWYDGGSADCTMCHSIDQSNAEAVLDPSSGLHYHATNPTGVDLHDNDFDASSGTCTSCHTATPSAHGSVVR